MGFRLGVDLGTTWTAAAVEEGGRTEPLTLGTHGWAVPSVVAVEGDQVLAGEAAARRGASDPTSAAREFKRRLGDPAPFVLGGSPYGAEALTAHLLAHVVAIATERQGGPPDTVALAHPAAWGEFKLDQLREAARLAGLDSAELVPEPAAAAIEYVRAGRVEANSAVAVYDFGGGTFDAAVVRADAERAELLGPAEGLERLGGVDLDTAVLAHVHEALGGALDDIDRKDPEVRRALARLREECIAAKEALSSDTEASIPVDLPGLRTEVRLTRAELEAMIRPRLDDTLAAMRRALGGAGMEADGISAVVLVGGTSRIPLVGQVLAETFGQPVLADIDPKLAVARGAATLGSAPPAADGAAVADKKEADGDEAADGDVVVAGAVSVGGDGSGPPKAGAAPTGRTAPTPSSGSHTARRVAAGAAVAGAAVAGTAAAATAWPMNDDGDNPDGQPEMTAPEEAAAPPPPPPPLPPEEEFLDVMDEVAPPPTMQRAAPAARSAPAMRRAAPRPDPPPRRPEPPPPPRHEPPDASRQAPPPHRPDGPDAPDAPERAGPPGTPPRPSPRPDGAPDGTRPAPPPTPAERLAAFKQERLENLAKWKPEGADPEEVAEFRRDAADLIQRFQPKPGESVEQAAAALQNHLGDRLSQFNQEQHAEKVKEALKKQEEAQQAKKADFEDDKAEYESTRQALKDAVNGYKPAIEGQVDAPELQRIKDSVIQRIDGKHFNDNLSVIQQQKLLTNEVANELRRWETAEYSERATARRTALEDATRRSQDQSLPAAERNAAADEVLGLSNQNRFISAFVEARTKDLQTDAGLLGNEAAAKIQATVSTDADDKTAAGETVYVDRMPPADLRVVATESGKVFSDKVAKKLTADAPTESVAASAAVKSRSLADVFETLATPPAATIAAAVAPVTPDVFDDDPVTPRATGPGSTPWGWDGKPLPPEMAHMRTLRAPATDDGPGPQSAVDDDDVLGIGGARASIPGSGSPAPGSVPMPAPDAPDDAGWRPTDDDQLAAPPPQPDFGPEPAMPEPAMPEPAMPSTPSTPDADDHAGRGGGGSDGSQDDVLGG